MSAFWKLAFDVRVSLYMDRVPTDANPADHPSRNRMDVGRSLGWIAVDPIFPTL